MSVGQQNGEIPQTRIHIFFAFNHKQINPSYQNYVVFALRYKIYNIKKYK